MFGEVVGEVGIGAAEAAAMLFDIIQGARHGEREAHRISVVVDAGADIFGELIDGLGHTGALGANILRIESDANVGIRHSFFLQSMFKTRATNRRMNAKIHNDSR